MGTIVGKSIVSVVRRVGRTRIASQWTRSWVPGHHRLVVSKGEGGTLLGYVSRLVKLQWGFWSSRSGMRLGKSPGDTRTKTLLGVARLFIITNMPSPGEHPRWFFFFPLGLKNLARQFHQLGLGCGEGEERVRYSLGKEDKIWDYFITILKNSEVNMPGS